MACWFQYWKNPTGSVDVKMNGSVLEEKSSFEMLGLTFFSKLDGGSYITSCLNWLQENWSFDSFYEAPFTWGCYLYKSTIRPCMEYCCHIWAGTPDCYLDLLDKLQKQIQRIVSSSLTSSLKTLAQCQNVASLSLFCMYYFGRYSSKDVHLAQLVPLPFPFLDGGLPVILIDCMILKQLGSGILCL